MLPIFLSKFLILVFAYRFRIELCVAEILKVGMSQAYKIVRTGKLKGYKEGRDWKILKPSLIKYVMEQSGL